MSESKVSFSIGKINMNWSVYQTLFYGLLAVMLLIMIPIAWTTGISGDEFIQYQYGKAIVDWFMNFGEATEANKLVFEEEGGHMYAYSSSFDFFTAAFNEFFGIEKVYEWRHVFNAISGWLLIVFAGLIAKEILGWRAALIAIFLIFISPRVIGHSWNNPKDIPFAMTYVMGLYYIMKYITNINNLTWKHKLMVSVSIGLAIGIRIGGLILIAYLLLFTALYFLYSSGGLKKAFTKEGIAKIKELIISSVVVSVGAYIVGIMFWPFALQSPLTNPMIALERMSDFSTTVGIRQLYDGEIVWSEALPDYYTLHYIFMTTPVIVILGFVLFFIFIAKQENKDSRFWKFVLLFAFLFPIFYIFYKHSMVYSGWRHTLFTYPAMTIASAIGFEYLLRQFKKPKTQIIMLSCLPILALHPIIHSIKNNPFQYIYFNELTGGVDNMVGKYENDYYYHSSRQAYNWLKENTGFDTLGNGKKINLLSNDHQSVAYFVGNDTDKVFRDYQRYYDRGQRDWDYFIVVNNYINPGQLRRGIWPPPNTVYEVKVDNTTIGAVLKRKTYKDFKGHQALQQGSIPLAIELLTEAIQEDPMVESAYLDLADAFLRAAEYEKGIAVTKQLLKIYPQYDKAFYSQSIILLNQGKYKECIEVGKIVLKLNPKYTNVYYISGVAYMQAGDPLSAIKSLKTCVEKSPGFKQAYAMLAEIYKQQGKTQEAEYYQSIVNQL